jgi:ElaB/YqjD/DUF883 family membrane-anchored ribosome-binding protein
MGRVSGNGGEATMRDTFERGTRVASEKLETAFEDVRDRAMTVGNRAVSFAKEHPVAAVAAGLGVGVIIAGLLRRR